MVERLLAHAVAGEHEAVGARVPDREAEHALELVHEVGSVLLVEVRQHLGVAAGAEAVPARREAIAQCPVVVDLAVADRDHVAGLVGERLRASGDVDDRETPAAERGVADGARSVAVGSTMGERSAHRRRHRVPSRRQRADHSVDAAHGPAGGARFAVA
jgi:hypothetical protein